jgi:hypothetical protein
LGAGSSQFKLQFIGVSFTEFPQEEEYIKPNSVEQLMTDDENENVFIIQMKNDVFIFITAEKFIFEPNIKQDQNLTPEKQGSSL